MNLRRLYDSIESDAEELVIKEKSIQEGTFMKAPNGKTSNLTESQWLQVRTKNFINWFGDWVKYSEEASKVLDENGEPLVVYHGSRKGEFDCFDTSKGNPCSSGALYFSDSLEFAKKFSGSEGHNYEVYLRIINPLRDGFDGSGATMSPSNYRDGGIFIKRQTDRYATKGTKEFIVFDPAQIKSVNNNGEFKPNNTNINK